MIHPCEMSSHSGKHAPPHVIRRFALAAALGSLIVAYAPTQAAPITLDMVTVGDPGNAVDPATGGGTPKYGSVNYSYQIGKYAVTIQQYTDFLNAVAATDAYSLYNTSMATNLNIAGISRSGSSGSYTYSVIGGSGNKPITYVSWWDAARFANWMQNGQGSGGTETGAYTLVGGQTSGTAPAKNPDAQFYIPTENEWYKAAYYSPTLNSGTGGYWKYATQSDSDPGNVEGGGANQANYQRTGVFAVTQSTGYSSSQNYLTAVGAFTSSPSFYDTFDQTGNVFQWNDFAGTAGSSRGLRGGAWDFSAYSSSSSYWSSGAPSFEDYYVGFRLAAPVAVPEPATWVMGLAGLACAGWGAARRTRRQR
ncbi:MAG: PEP-CTERM sorting domain-containing protein [Planctomycetia bacterium]|nr:PEP-CTERM sorting domain-containing protein [Planctomycetia bacterium]